MFFFEAFNNFLAPSLLGSNHDKNKSKFKGFCSTFSCCISAQICLIFVENIPLMLTFLNTLLKVILDPPKRSPKHSILTRVFSFVISDNVPMHMRDTPLESSLWKSYTSRWSGVKTCQIRLKCYAFTIMLAASLFLSQILDLKTLEGSIFALVW